MKPGDEKTKRVVIKINYLRVNRSYSTGKTEKTSRSPTLRKFFYTLPFEKRNTTPHCASLPNEEMKIINSPEWESNAQRRGAIARRPTVSATVVVSILNGKTECLNT